MRWKIGEWTADEETDTLVSGDQRRKIERRAMHLLAYLAGRAGSVVSKDELIDAVWGRVAISDHSVAIVVSQLRRSLDDDRRAPRYIETITKRGYRLIAPVSVIDAPAEASASPAPSTSPARPPSRRVLVGGSAAGLVLAAGAFAAWRMRPQAVPLQGPRVVAIAEFANDTGTDAYGHTVFALNELISTELSQESSNDVQRWRGADLDMMRRALSGRRARVVTGRLILDGTDPLFAVQVVDLTDRRLLWGETYAVRNVSIAARARQISRDIAASLGEDLRELPDAHPFPAEAHELYWRARYLWSLREDDSPRRARDLLLQLVRLYPAYAPAHAALADIYAHKTGEHLGLGRTDTFVEADRHLARAKALIGQSSETEVTDALLAFYRDRKAAVALAHANEAIRRRPGNALAWQTAAMILSAQGRFMECLRAIGRAAVLDPASDSILWDRVWFLYVAGRYAEALAAADAARKVSAPVFLYYALTYDALGREPEALQAWIDRAHSHGLDSVAAARARAAVRGTTGAAAYSALIGALATSKTYSDDGVPMAVLLVHAGRPDAAILELARFDNPRDAWLGIWADRVPALRPLLGDPRVRRLSADLAAFHGR
jgi:DNA-binding winged helix-turn-helix (wHTH) protein/tetratricopeptide (TPR) repeat protein